MMRSGLLTPADCKIGCGYFFDIALENNLLLPSLALKKLTEHSLRYMCADVAIELCQVYPHEYRRALAEAAAEAEQAKAQTECRISEDDEYKEDNVILEDVLKSAKEVVSEYFVQ